MLKLALLGTMCYMTGAINLTILEDPPKDAKKEADDKKAADDKKVDAVKNHPSDMDSCPGRCLNNDKSNCTECPYGCSTTPCKFPAIEMRTPETDASQYHHGEPGYNEVA